MRPRSFFCPAFACLALVAGLPAAAESQGYLRHPDLHGDRVVFAAEGDLWIAPVAGGAAAWAFGRRPDARCAAPRAGQSAAHAAQAGRGNQAAREASDSCHGAAPLPDQAFRQCSGPASRGTGH